MRRAAPILSYMIGWTERRALDYIRRKRWTYETYDQGLLSLLHTNQE